MKIKRKHKLTLTILLLLIFLPFVLEKKENRKSIKEVIKDLSSTQNDKRGRSIAYLINAKPSATVLMIKALDENHVKERTKIDILQILEKRVNVKISDKLLAYLNDENWKIRFFAIKVLKAHYEPYLLNELLNRWKNENKKANLIELAYTICQIEKTENVLDTLEKTFDDTQDKNKRALSALVIYELTENEEYSDFLLEVLKNGESIADNIIIAAYYLYFYDFKNSSRLFDQIFSDLDEDVKNKFQKKYGSGKEGRS